MLAIGCPIERYERLIHLEWSQLSAENAFRPRLPGGLLGNSALDGLSFASKSVLRPFPHGSKCSLLHRFAPSFPPYKALCLSFLTTTVLSVDPVHLNKSSIITEGITIGKAVESGTHKPAAKAASEKADKSSPYSSGLARNGKQAKRNGWVEETKESPASMLSFIFNDDMRRVRNAEAIILKAEEQFGIFSRDPDGRLVPITQALTRKAAVELKKDDRRPITEPSQTTFTYAPHAIQGGVGMAEAGWAPPILTPQQLLGMRSSCLSTT